jgi:Domain of unknown function (DUF4145)
MNWTCPFCDRPQIVTDGNRSISQGQIYVGHSVDGKLGYSIFSIACLNEVCRKTSVRLSIGGAEFDRVGNYKGLNNEIRLFSEQILPRGTVKPQPDFIPAPLREDYVEACLIRELSPKASATLIRRCLQGMIRDFAGISKKQLIDEIKALRAAVEDGTADRSITPETVEAIDHIRGVGNIGAHMEKDIDHIVPVDPGEAQALIELVEMLFEEWYVAREQRKQKLNRIAGIASEKKALKNGDADSPAAA